MTADQIQSLLQAKLAPEALAVQDDSHLHAGHAGAREGGDVRIDRPLERGERRRAPVHAAHRAV